MRIAERGMRDEKRKGTGITIAAGILAVFLHGVVFSVPMVLMPFFLKPSTDNRQPTTEKNTIHVELAVLPAIIQRGNESVIKEEEGKKPENAREPGLAGQAQKQGSADAENEMLTYQDMIKQKIQQSRKYPVEARQKGIEGAVEMAFTVLRQGALKAVEVTGASGFVSLDEEAAATIKRASPFPAFPEAFTGREMTLKVKIVFDIE